MRLKPFRELFTIMLFVSMIVIPLEIAMSHEHDTEYLSDAQTVDSVYALVTAGKIDEAADFFKALGADQAVITTWMNVQCDINNVKKDPRASAQIGQVGVDYCLEKNYLVPAAMMLHNIASFFMTDFDENVAPADVPTILEAAKRQTILRRQIKQESPLMWALWDEGLAHLANKDAEQAILFLSEGAELGCKMEDRDGEAWCNLFIGKTKVKLMPERKAEGIEQMNAAAKVIMEVGEDWEKESLPEIFKPVGLEWKK